MHSTKRRCLIFLLGIAVLALPRRSDALPPVLAATFSVVPGLGQAAHGDVLEGIAWFGSSVGLYFYGYQQSNSSIELIGQNLWFYNVYDAYRDAGGKDTTKHSVFEDYIATFNPLNIVDPFAPVGIGYGLYAVSKSTGSGTALGPTQVWMSPFFFGFVGLGEEGLFRGFLFPALSQLFFDSYIAGALLSSAVFSAAHMVDGTAESASTPALTLRFALGLLFAGQTYYNKFDLRKSIFTHAWYDVTIDYGERNILAIGQKPVRGKDPLYKLKMGTTF